MKALCSHQGVVSFHPLVVLFSVCPADMESLRPLAPWCPLQPGLTLSEGPGSLPSAQAKVEGASGRHLELVLISDSWHFCIWTESRGGFPLRAVGPTQVEMPSGAGG